MNGKLSRRTETLLSAFQARNLHDLKRLANDSIQEAVTENNKNLAEIAVISYALYKIISKDHFTKNPKWQKVANTITSGILKANKAIEKNEPKAFQKNLNNVILEIELIDEKLSNFAKSIFYRAKVKQASTAYALGISFNHAAELTGANLKTLQNYIGTTRIHDEQPIYAGISKRLTTLKRVLNDSNRS